MTKERLVAAVAKAKELLFDDLEVKAKWEDVTKVDSFRDFCQTPSLLVWLGKRVALAVEIVQKEYRLIEADERLDVAAKILDDLFEFKGWAKILELVDDKIFRVVLGVIVNFMNEKLGNSWIGKTFSDL